MFPSSALCRAQESLQRDRAINADLANVRVLAGRAATAWKKEALIAEQRERHKARLKPVISGTPVRQSEADVRYDQSLSENPDRGFASS